MKLKSYYFKNLEEALHNTGNLTAEDNDSAWDRQVIANFYNGRELMSVAEGERENVGSLVNHLFGYNALNGFKLQIGSIYGAGDYLWNYKLSEQVPASTKRTHETEMSKSMDLHIKRSRRLKPEFNAMAGDLVMHGRAIMMFRDNFDWCPQLTHLYVPKGTAQMATAIPYAFAADNIPYYKLKEHLRHAEENPDSTKWDAKELKRAVEYLEDTGSLRNTPHSRKYNEENENQAENTDEQVGHDRATAMDLPVWYLYEVDHSDPLLPVDVKIITRYDVVLAQRDRQEKRPSNAVVFQHQKHFRQISHWIHPIFMDTEIGGKATWHSVTGVGRLNYERDGDVEEFFNLAMEGAKDKMRTKWKVLDGATREKVQRFFAERQDLIPEGLEAAEIKQDANYQHAFTVLQMLRALSKEDAGGATTNQGQDSDELEIQAAERQQKAGFQVAARMDDVYDALDGLGAEIARRFLNMVIDKTRTGYREVSAFRNDMEVKQIPYESYGVIDDNGYFDVLEIKTNRAAGDGSESTKRAVNGQLMAWIGQFAPESQEVIKRRVVNDLTRDPDFASEIVPFEAKPDPDQVARARTENTAALDRGITDFVPDRAQDDVDQIHLIEHQNALQAHILKGRAKQFFDECEAKGFQSLATHHMIHIRGLQQTGTAAEPANEFFQTLQGMTREADALTKQGEQKLENDKVDPVEIRKLEQKDRELDQREREFISLDQDRQRRAQLDEQDQALTEVTKIAETAQKGAALVQPPQNANI